MGKKLRCGVFLVWAALAASPVCGADSYPASLASSLPHYAGLGLSWSEAHIGNFPHVGIGLTLGFVTTSFGELASHANGTDTAKLAHFADAALLPAYVVDARLGGYFIPFDVGVKVGYMPDLMEDKDADSWFNFLIYGIDIRYAVLKGSGVLPKLSLGIGYNGLTGGLGFPLAATVGEDDSAVPPAPSGRFDFLWNTTALEFKAQASKDFRLLTPYVGAAGGIARVALSRSTKAGTAVTTLDSEGSVPFVRIFGGVSLNGAVSKADLQLMLCLPKLELGISAGVRAIR
jgi:hypothetical protein